MLRKSRTVTKWKERHPLQNSTQYCSSFLLHLELELVQEFSTCQVHILGTLSCSTFSIIRNGHEGKADSDFETGLHNCRCWQDAISVNIGNTLRLT